ncbi:unnamed protein product [Sphenostylis stenocarpa]|uniref:Calcineurin B-like protein n=1 Tax=Sphenostylis stenocarpa TaxID=92480 RepID=A0AA86VUS7_9FABA|nr:unnamed protein product [Sphenostylis stenocarpa]
MGCHCSKKAKLPPGYEEPAILAAETPFNANDVEALYELYKKLSNSVIQDGLIHKGVLISPMLVGLVSLILHRFKYKLVKKLGLMNSNGALSQIFDLFDLKRNGVIGFGEFVRSLAIFHPDSPLEDKIQFAFRVYDLRQTGYIEREELKEMVMALLHESDVLLSDDLVELIVNKTFNDADTKRDGKIDQDEWKAFVTAYPSLLKNMTLPYLKDVTLTFPSFVVRTESEDSDI